MAYIPIVNILRRRFFNLFVYQYWFSIFIYFRSICRIKSWYAIPFDPRFWFLYCAYNRIFNDLGQRPYVFLFNVLHCMIVTYLIFIIVIKPHTKIATLSLSSSCSRSCCCLWFIILINCRFYGMKSLGFVLLFQNKVSMLVYMKHFPFKLFFLIIKKY